MASKWSPSALVASSDMDRSLQEALELSNSLHKPVLGPEGRVEIYNRSTVCENYDKSAEVMQYKAPQRVAQLMCDLYPDLGHRETVRILDVAAGTGVVGQELQKVGFRLMDALDPSEGMLAVAARKGIYSQLLTYYLTDQPLPIGQDSYDAIVMAGGMGDNHVPCAAVHEMIRLVKPGGYIVNASRTEYMTKCPEYVGRLPELMDRLEREGRWKQVTKVTVPNLLFDREGFVLVHQVL